MRFYLLTKEFYIKYNPCKEILKKEERPYMVYAIKMEGLIFAIPIRHNIKHKYCIKTLEQQGLDLSKTVVLRDETYLSQFNVHIDKEEYLILSEKKSLIGKELMKYIKLYKKALKYPKDNKNKVLIENSALQYFHEELGILEMEENLK